MCDVDYRRWCIMANNEKNTSAKWNQIPNIIISGRMRVFKLFEKCQTTTMWSWSARRIIAFIISIGSPFSLAYSAHIRLASMTYCPEPCLCLYQQKSNMNKFSNFTFALLKFTNYTDEPSHICIVYLYSIVFPPVPLAGLPTCPHPHPNQNNWNKIEILNISLYCLFNDACLTIINLMIDLIGCY